MIHEIVKDKDFQKSNTEIEAYESMEELKYPQEYEDRVFINWDDLIEEGRNDPWVRAMFKRSGHNILSIFMITHDYHELPTRTIRAIRNIYHIFKPNSSRDVRNLYQDKTSRDMTLEDIKYLTNTCCDEKYQPLTIDMTKDNYTGCYRIGLNSIFVPKSSPF